MKHSKAISWIDDCRIPFVETENTNNWTSTRNKKPEKTGWFFRGDNGGPEMNKEGRFPANLLVCDDMLNDGKIYKSGEGKPHHKRNKTLGEYQGNAYGKFNNTNPQLNYENYYGDKGTNSRYYNIDKWFDNILDE